MSFNLTIFYIVFIIIFLSYCIVETQCSRQNKLLPKLLPHSDNRSLLEFYVDDSDPCKMMDIYTNILEKEYGVKFRKIKINDRQDFYTAFEFTGGNEGGSLPFFFNRRTATAISGITSYENLLNLCFANNKHRFQLAPDRLIGIESKKNLPKQLKSIGYRNFFNDLANKYFKAYLEKKKSTKL